MTTGSWRYYIRFWLPVILWMCFIFWMSTDTFSSENTSSWVEAILYLFFPGISAQTVDLIHTLLRKLGHVTEYFILGLLLFRAFRGETSKKWSWRWTVLALLFVVCYAASDEFHQSFSLAREASVTDVGIDTLGGILSQIAVAFTFSRRERNTT
jgi:VanZ family protein